MSYPAYDPKKKVTQLATPTPMPGYTPPNAQQTAYAASLEKQAANMPKPTGQPTQQLQGMYDGAVKQNGGIPLPSGNDSVKNWASTPVAQPNTVNMPPTAMSAVSTNVPTMPMYQDAYAKSPEQIKELARQRIQERLQAGRTSAQGALKGAKTAYDYTNQIEGDQRTLRNFEFKNRNDPFSGQTGYLASQMLRGDAVDDTFQDQNYNNQVGLINQRLADLEAAAPGEEQAIIDELQQIERQTGISVAQLQESQRNNQFNQFDSNRKFEYDTSPNNPGNIGQNITNQLNQLKLDDYPAESKAAAQQTQLDYETGKINKEVAQLKLTELKDPNSFTNRTAKLDFEMKQLEAKNFPETERLKLQQLKKQIAEIGVTHYKPQTEEERQYEEQQLIKIKAEIKKIQDSSSKPVVDPKASIDTYSGFIQDLEQVLNEAEANELLEANRNSMTDADYKAAKKAIIDVF